ncbi:MAG: hypothetical protein Q8K67_13815 [Geothrix sp.]|nr:hypothetical protein [Geothrix sp.]
MLIAVFLSALLQTPPAPATAITHRPALPALAAKAPGKPEYGIHITTPVGQFILTNLRFTPQNPRGMANAYGVTGPAGMGPYRLGVQLGGPLKYVNQDLKGIYPGRWFKIEKAVKGGAALEAGLDEDWSIISVDGQDFGGNLNALIAYMTTRPAIEVLALKAKGWGMTYKQKTFKIQLRKLDAPVDPTDGVLIPGDTEALRPILQDIKAWSVLLAQRSALPRFTPLAVDLSGRRMWAVRGTRNPHPDQGVPPDLITLEFWGEDPAVKPDQDPAALWPEPEDGLRSTRALRVEDRWYRIQEVAVDAASGRLLKLALQPWAADVPALLGGGTLARDLGRGAAAAHREALEQLGNEALVEWKTRTLPGLLATQGLGPVEDLVIRAEKGLLTLDLEVKGIRTRLDAAARAETERKAQAELAAKDGKAAPLVQAAPATESERLADLLEQRKAILMAILGSAKQALSNLRR